MRRLPSGYQRLDAEHRMLTPVRPAALAALNYVELGGPAATARPPALQHAARSVEGAAGLVQPFERVLGRLVVAGVEGLLATDIAPAASEKNRCFRGAHVQAGVRAPSSRRAASGWSRRA
jgi:hypothetical protein